MIRFVQSRIALLQRLILVYSLENKGIQAHFVGIMQFLRFFNVFFSFATVLSVFAMDAFAQNITVFRTGAQMGGLTRLVIESDGPLAYNVDTLPSPPRVVFDVNSSANISPSRISDATGLITAVRFGRPNNATKRIVFDLSRAAVVKKHFALPPSGANKTIRTVIDLDPVGTVVPKPEPLPKIADIEPRIVDITPRILYENQAGIPNPRPQGLEPPAAPRQKYLVVLDPGHGGADPGAIGHNGIREKDIVLSLAKKVRQRLEASGRFEVVMTRESDYYIKLRDRFKKARDKKAHLFISLHADKIHVPSVRGASVYTLSETASDKETARLAQQENNAGIVAGVDLAIEDDTVADILLDLARRETLNESKLFANLFVNAMKDKGIRRLKNPHRYAGFAVLKAPDVPSVLIEAGFMSNKGDAVLLQSREYQQKVASAIHLSVDKFFDRIEYLQSQ